MGCKKNSSQFILRFNTIILVISILLSCYRQKPSIHENNNIRIFILSKHNLKSITLRAKGRLFVNGKTMIMNDMPVSIFLKNGSLFLKNSELISLTHAIAESDRIVVDFSKNGILEHREYSGSIAISLQENNLQLVNETNVESYVSSAVQSETNELLVHKKSPKQKENFTKAMEIVIRSYALANRNRHKKEDADLCDLTHCIHFHSDIFQRPLSKSDVIIYKSQILPAYFHSTCGGNLTSPEVYWSENQFDNAYRIGRDEENGQLLCRDSPHHKWSNRLDEIAMKKITGQKIKKIDLVKKQGRVSELIFLPTNNNKVKLQASQFISQTGKLLGWNMIKSNDFTIFQEKNGFELSGFGLGHGIGLCQWGAFELAENKNYTEILHFYYPQTSLARVEFK